MLLVKKIMIIIGIIDLKPKLNAPHFQRYFGAL